jgi:hypothetical protein
MAIQVAYINTEGEIQYWISPGVDSHYTDGSTENGFLVKTFLATDDIKTFRQTNVWNFTSSSWDSRTWKDSNYHTWTNSSWNYSSDAFIFDVRSERTNKLYASDWTQLTDSPLTDAQKASYTTYRQQLRDFPGTLDLSSEPTDVQSLSWPTEPTI